MRISDWSSDVCSSDLGASRYLDAFLEMLLAERGAAANTVLAYARDLADCAAVVAGRGGRRSDDPDTALAEAERGRASGRDNVCQEVEITVVRVSLTTKNTSHQLERRPD